MARGRDPVEVRDEGDQDLYEVSSWEVRSRLDGFAVWLHAALVRGARLFVVLVALGILLLQVAVGGIGAVVQDPVVGGFALLSVVPALALAAVLWQADVTTREPLELIVATFVLGVLFAGFAGVLNTITFLVVEDLGLAAGTVGVAVQVGVFFVVVGPVEEAMKLLAVRLYVFRSGHFDAVIDGAVYGAVAGLGFATIENIGYISGVTSGVADPADLVVASGAVAAVRALAGPGHVIYSAFAGYYLGLAKFNPERAGPIVVKGLLVAAVIHATYNSLAGVVPGVVADVLGVPWFVGFFGFVVVYDGFFGLLLLGKIARYREAYHAVHDEEDAGKTVELTEFDA